MARWIPKTLLKWHEPREFAIILRAIEREKLTRFQRILPFLVVGLIFGAIFLLLWAMAWLYPDKSPVSAGVAVIVAATFGGLIALAVWVSFRFGKTEISIHENGVMRYRQNHAENWTFEEIDSFEFGELTHREARTEVFILRLANGGSAVLGLDPWIEKEQISDLFQASWGGGGEIPAASQ